VTTPGQPRVAQSFNPPNVNPKVRTPVGDAPIIPIILIGIGAYLAWFAIHYWDSSTKWPTDPVKAVLTGKPLPTSSGQTPAASDPNAQQTAEAGGAANTGPAGKAPAVSGGYDLAALQTLWISQGGATQTAFEAANVAMAESGSPGGTASPTVTSSNPDGGINVGLWQLDTKGVGSGYTIAQLQDPATNARITVLASANGTNWSHWADAVVSNGEYTGPTV
jgi:hypothetical protein